VDEHLKRALEHIPKTEQVCKAIEKRNRENESHARVFWTSKGKEHLNLKRAPLKPQRITMTPV